MKRGADILGCVFVLLAFRIGPSFHAAPLPESHAVLQELTCPEGTTGLLWNDDPVEDGSEAIKHRIAAVPPGAEAGNTSMNEPAIGFSPSFLSDPLLTDRPPPVLHG
jgi:hypothetical protein